MINTDTGYLSHLNLNWDFHFCKLVNQNPFIVIEKMCNSKILIGKFHVLLCRGNLEGVFWTICLKATQIGSDLLHINIQTRKFFFFVFLVVHSLLLYISYEAKRNTLFPWAALWIVKFVPIFFKANLGKVGPAGKIFLDSEVCVKPVTPWDFSLYIKDGKTSTVAPDTSISQLK